MKPGGVRTSEAIQSGSESPESGVQESGCWRIQNECSGSGLCLYAGRTEE